MNATPNYDASLEFLRQFHPARRWVLTAISLDKRGVATDTFDANREAACREWLERYGADRNIYFSVGEIARDVGKKAERTDIARVWWFHVDIDPRAGEDIAAEQQRVLGLLRNPPGLLPPTCIVFSGGGYQGFWALREPINTDCKLELAEEAKLYNLRIELALGADNVHDVSRIMRLPGTVNRPDALKVKKGRTPALAEVIEWHADRIYNVDQFEKAPPPASVATRSSAPKVSGPVKRFANTDELPDKVSPTAKVIICQGFNPDEPNKFSGRSEWLFYVCCELVRGGCTDEQIYSVITDPNFAISASVLDKGSNIERYALRQIERARSQSADFQKDNNDRIIPSQYNIRLALGKLGAAFSYDCFANKLKLAENGHTEALDDAAVERLYLAVDETFKLRPAFDLFEKIIRNEARRNTYHPVRDYLDSLKWDGVPRVGNWLVAYGGAEDSEFNRAAGALPLIAAVRRVRQPGCKFDEMLVLESPQGQLKSTALQALAVNADWFSDDLPLNADTTRQIEALAGRWIVEAGELKGMRKGDVESLKGFLSRQSDSARLAYGRLAKDYPRQCIIIGTTNSTKYLKDMTGNRRFWPVHVGTFDIAALRRDRDQLWAEAAHREAQGETTRLDPKLYGEAAKVQAEREQTDPFEEILRPLLRDLSGKLSTEDAWKLIGKMDPGRRTQDDMNRLGEVMRKLGWDRQRKRRGGNLIYAYVRGEKDVWFAARGSPDDWRLDEAAEKPPASPF